MNTDICLKLRINKVAGLLLILAVLLVSASAVHGATRTWTGGYWSGYWSAPLNWDTGVPQSGDDLVFPSGIFGADLISTNNLGNRKFSSITISGNGYVLRGSSGGATVTLINQLRSTANGSSNWVELNIELASSVSFSCSWSNADLYMNGNVDLGSYTLTTLGAGRVRLGGAISGAGGIVKSGSGTHWMQGSVANSYTGTTQVNSGTLNLDKTVTDGAINGGALIIGNASGAADSTIVREVYGYQIGLVPITIHSDGWLDMGNYQDTVGAITFNGGHAGSGATGMLRLGGNVTVNASSEEALLDGNVYFSGTRTFTVGNGTAGYDLKGSAVFSGNGIVKTGTGTLGLLAANTYTGTTSVNQGRLYITHDNALGATTSGTTVSGTGYIQMISADVGAESLTLSRPNSSGNALTASGTSSWAGPVTLSADVGISTGGTLDFSGVISGTGGISMNGYGTYIFSGTTANSYAGATMVNDGTLLLNKSGYNAIRYGSLTIGNNLGAADEVVVRALDNHQINNGVPITINMDGHLDVDAYTDSVGAIAFNGGHAGSTTGTMTLNGNVTVNASSSEALLDGKVNMGGVTRTFDVANGSVGYDLRVTAVLSGSGLIKTGAGLMALQGANTFSGAATVNQGRLYVLNDSAFGTTVSGTTVSGSGFIQLVSADIGPEPLTLARTSAGTVLYASGSSSWAGDIILDEDASIASGGTLGLSGGISGAGGIRITSGGTITFSGSTGNTYGGDTMVLNSTLILDKSAGNSIPNSLSIGGNSPGDPAAVVQQSAGAEIGLDVTVNASGTYAMNNYSEAIRHLNLNGGADIDSGVGTLTVSGDINVDPLSYTNVTATISGKLALSGTTELAVPQGVASSGNPSDLVINAVISGGGKILKTGNGELQLTAANTFTGPFSVNDGGLRLDNNLGLGSTAGGVTVNGDAYLQIHGGGHTITGEHLTLNSSYVGWGTLYSTSGPNVWTGDITLQSDAAVGVGGSAELTLSGSIGGSGDLRKVNTGTVILSGSTANTYTGNTYVDRGTLALNKSIYNDTILGRLYIGDGVGGADADVVRLLSTSQIKNSERVIISGSGLFDINNVNEEIGSLSGSGHVDLGNGNLLTGGSGLSTIYSGLIEGSGILRKLGAGTFTLTGNNTYSGNTQISYGTLRVNGTQPSSDVVVGTLGRLSGIGSVGAITSNGRVAPGASAGQLGCANATLQSGSTFELELNGYTLVDYDQLDVNGSTTLNNPNLSIAWGFVPAVGDSFTIVDNDGGDAVSGTFNGLAEGASVVAGNVTLQISYVGGTGNDVVLATTAVTELEPLMITSIEEIGGNIQLEWIGGVPYYVVEKKTALTNATWIAITTPTRDMDATVPADTTNGFYRVTGGN